MHQAIYSLVLCAAMIETGVYNTIVYHAWPYSLPMYVLCLPVIGLLLLARREVQRWEKQARPAPGVDEA